VAEEPTKEAMAMAETGATLHGISEVRAFLRTNRTPIHFVSPTAFNLLGIDRWLRSFFYVNYYDSFDGSHPQVFVPSEHPCGACSTGSTTPASPSRSPSAAGA
jgi:hypothetical protein